MLNLCLVPAFVTFSNTNLLSLMVEVLRSSSKSRNTSLKVEVLQWKCTWKCTNSIWVLSGKTYSMQKNSQCEWCTVIYYIIRLVGFMFRKYFNIPANQGGINLNYFTCSCTVKYITIKHGLSYMYLRSYW